MATAQLDNPNPTVSSTLAHPRRGAGTSLSERVFDVIRDIRDPEHPHTLEELSVVSPSSITIIPAGNMRKYGRVCVEFEPTVPHCSLASVIGLSIIQKLRLSGHLNNDSENACAYYKLKVTCEKDSHSQAIDINRQLADKERVSAALENPSILSLLSTCIANLPS